MNKKLFLFVVPLVLISLCTSQQPATVTGQGLEITNFTSDQDQVYSGRSVRLSMDVANLGQTTVWDSVSLVYLMGSNLNLDDTSGISWYNPDETLYKHFGKDMRPADPSRGVTADEKLFTWRLTAPTLPRGQTLSSEFTGRVYYEYQTVTRGTIWVYSEAEADAAKNKGEALETSSFTSSAGPVSAGITVGPDPPIVSASDNGFTMNINLKNKEGGTVYRINTIDYNPGTEDISLGTDDLNYVNVTIEGAAGLNITGCLGDQEMIGADTTLICDVVVNSDSLPATKTGFSPVITVAYGYYNDKKVSVEVIGK